MRKLLLALLYAATFLTCYLPPFASACGDKLLMLGRGVKFGSISSSYHGSIIAYVPESVLQSAAINDAQFQQTVRKAGHRLRLVRQVDALAEAVQSGSYDIILVDPQDAAVQFHHRDGTRRPRDQGVEHDALTPGGLRVLYQANYDGMLRLGRFPVGMVI